MLPVQRKVPCARIFSLCPAGSCAPRFDFTPPRRAFPMPSGFPAPVFSSSARRGFLPPVRFCPAAAPGVSSALPAQRKVSLPGFSSSARWVPCARFFFFCPAGVPFLPVRFCPAAPGGSSMLLRKERFPAPGFSYSARRGFLLPPLSGFAPPRRGSLCPAGSLRPAFLPMPDKEVLFTPPRRGSLRSVFLPMPGGGSFSPLSDFAPPRRGSLCPAGSLRPDFLPMPGKEVLFTPPPRGLQIKRGNPERIAFFFTRTLPNMALFSA